jgi:DNA-directed RNA polymerase specialized sigma24 family protein
VSQVDVEFFEREWAELEGPLTTMARKFEFAIPGHDVEDIVAEFKVEAFRKLEWFDPSKSSFKTFVWNLSFKIRHDLVSKFNAQGRDFKREAHHYVETASGQMADEGEGDPYAVVPLDEFHAAIAEQIGNAGRFSQILQLESVDRVGKIVLFCLATGFNINETCYHVREAVGPNPDGSEFWFHRSEFNRVRKSLQSNSEVRALVA